MTTTQTERRQTVRQQRTVLTVSHSVVSVTSLLNEGNTTSIRIGACS